MTLFCFLTVLVAFRFLHPLQNCIYLFSLYLTGSILHLRYIDQLMPLRNTIAVYCENHMEHVDKLELDGRIQFWHAAAGLTFANQWI
jgi:hypothetical protein